MVRLPEVGHSLAEHPGQRGAGDGPRRWRGGLRRAVGVPAQPHRRRGRVAAVTMDRLLAESVATQKLDRVDGEPLYIAHH